MLFDLRSRGRRRVIKTVYLFLAILIGVGVAIAAPLGDLFESFIKRQAGVKDSGRVFGAHGGALDRLDAVLFSAVVSYYVWLAILSAR